MKYLKKTIAGVVVLAAGAAFQVAAAADTYKVSATLSHAGEVIGSPTALVRADEPASVSVSGEGGYTFSFTVSELAPDEIRVAANVSTVHGDMAPTLVVRPGKTATVASGELTLALTVSRDAD